MTLTASVEARPGRSRTWLDGVASLPAPSGAELTLRRSWPRSADHALLEYTGAPTPEGVVVGQWFADAQRARHVAAATVAATASVGGVVLHQRGADRRLAALPQLLADPSARLVVHRPERRAVVRLDPRSGVRGQRQWVKVVRTEQLERLVARATALDGSGLVAPQLVDVHADDGVTVWSDVAGSPLSDLLDSPSVHEVMGHVAGVVQRLHTSAPPPDAEAHTAGHEIGVLQRWLGLLEHYDPEVHRRAAPLLGPVAALLDRDAHTTGRLGTVHRDLHDGQLLVDGPRIGLLDPDTLALGEPELDLANLAAHLRLAACAGRCGEAVPGAAVDALLDAYGRDRVRPARLRAYLAASLLRLVAVHAFRPATRGAALGLAASVEEVLHHEG